MTKRNWDNKKIIKEIKENGYYIFKNFFDEDSLKEIKDSLLNTLHYIKKDDETDLQKKYYQIKKYNPKLKGNWYDMANYNITLYQYLHSKDVTDFIKEFFKTEVVFSARPCIHVHDDSNDYLLDPHQETNLFAKDGILLWSPIYDTNKDTGGLAIYKKSHKHGFFDHSLEHPKLGKKAWTKAYTHIDPEIVKKFERVELEVEAGSAVLAINSLVHSGYQMKKKGHARITITERYNPLKKIPYLKDEKAPLKIPYVFDYDQLVD